MHVTGSAIETKAAVSALGNLSAHDDDVDRAPADGDGAVLWDAAADLVAAAEGRTSYQLFESWIGSAAGKFILLSYTWALIHHLLGGLRHFAWDTGRTYKDGLARQWDPRTFQQHDHENGRVAKLSVRPWIRLASNIDMMTTALKRSLSAGSASTAARFPLPDCVSAQVVGRLCPATDLA